MKKEDKRTTLSDSEISTQPNISRRSLLRTIGIGTGVAAATIVGAASTAEARRVCDYNSYDRCFDVTDSDPGDRASDPYDRR